MEDILLAQIIDTIDSIRTELREGIGLLRSAKSDSLEVFSKVAGEIELVESNVRDAVCLRIVSRETSSLHIALSCAHDAFLWLAAFATIEWYQVSFGDAERKAKFKSVAERCEGLLDVFDKTRAALPYDKVPKEMLQ